MYLKYAVVPWPQQPQPPVPPTSDADRAARWVKEDMAYKEALGIWQAQQLLLGGNSDQVYRAAQNNGVPSWTTSGT